jgi:hypothetical protein
MDEENNEPSISINDLNLSLQVIDVCSERGAFKGAELTDIGILRDKLYAFIEANKPDENEAEPETEEVEKIPEQLEFDFKEEE